MDIYVVVWLVFTVLFLILEAMTVGLVSIWFAAGALAAFIAALLGASFGLQIGLFVAVTAVLLIFTMPLAKSFIKTRGNATNSDRIIGQKAVVIDTIDDISGTGQVKVMGNIWSAKSADGSIIEEGAVVYIKEIQGVKAVVEIKKN